MSSTRVLKRLTTMDRREMWSRAATAGRRQAGRIAYLARRPRWRRAALARALASGIPPNARALARLHEEDWIGAHDVLVRHFASRRPRFVLDAAARPDRSRTIHQYFPDARAEAVRLADEVVGGRFNLLGYRGLTFSHADPHPRIDWHFDPVHQRRAPRTYWSQVPYLEPRCGDHKIVWELNRHQSWLTLGRAYWLTGDERYRAAFTRQLDSWMRANPPLCGVNWASMLELAFRSISWVWALHFFALDRPADDGARVPWTVDLLLGLDRQLRLVDANLSRYFSPNTHLLGEALALYVAGRVLPELGRAARWDHVGGTVLIEQISRQIEADGGHVELSTHYHRYTLDFYLLALAVARQTADARAPLFAEAVERLARYARTMSDDNGRLPAIGDDDGGSLFPLCGRHPSDVGDSLQLAAHLIERPALAVGPAAEEVTWITGIVPAGPSAPSRWPSTALPSTGYFVSRSVRGDHLTIDAGRHGFLNGGHAHADALAITLAIRGRPFLNDPGTGCYTIDPVVRDRFRSTRYHNTLTIDGRSQSIPDGPFHWRSTAHASALDWHARAEADFFEGAHDGYAPLAHRRALLARPGCWIVVDRVLGAGVHLADAHWHIDPLWETARTGPRSVLARHVDGATAWILALRGECEVFRGSREQELGWCAPVYGLLVPTSTVRMRRTAKAPFEFVTVIVEAAEEPAAEVMPHEREELDGGRGIRFTIQTASSIEIVHIATRAADPAHAGGLDRLSITVEGAQ
jgi:hypothetical protein